MKVSRESILSILSELSEEQFKEFISEIIGIYTNDERYQSLKEPGARRLFLKEKMKNRYYLREIILDRAVVANDTITYTANDDTNTGLPAEEKIQTHSCRGRSVCRILPGFVVSFDIELTVLKFETRSILFNNHVSMSLYTD